MDTPTETPVRNRWRFLTPTQRALADDLMRRAEKIRATDDELSIAEAVAVAAAQLGYPLLPAGTTGPAYLNGPVADEDGDSA